MTTTGGMMQRLSISQRHSHHEYGGQRRWFQVFIHPDLDHLQRAAKRYRPETEWTGTAACVHPAPVRMRFDEGSGQPVNVSDPHWAGVVRFSADRLYTEIVAHEMVHAALAIYRMDVCTDVRLGNGCRDREEILAYITGDLISAASRALYDSGAWQ